MSQILIEYYKSIEESSLKMLAAAQAQDWDQVVRCEGACAVLIEQLRMRGRSDELEPEQKREKAKIMRRILLNDAQIRYLAEPWLDQLDKNSVDCSPFLH
jgi:flagellar protein FliT